ncbi:MAG: ROK family glucokinase [Angustibacter sp.]
MNEQVAEAPRQIWSRPAIGIDVGGTKVAAGLVDVDGRVLRRARRPTPHRTRAPQVVEDTIAEAIEELRDHRQAIAVGIGAAGFIDASQSTVLFAPHLSWRHEPLRDAVRRRVGLPVLVDNDANAALWAEARFGAGRGHGNVVEVNLGTGIGGALLVGGQLYRGQFGVAGELGHVQVVPGGHRCECGNRGCWEQYASGNAVVREARELAHARSPLAYRMLELAGGEPDRITGPLVTQAATAGDPAARELLEDAGRWLGVGLANLAAVLDPGMFIVGGGVSEAGDLLLEPAREAFRRQLTGRGFRPEAEIVPARLGNDAGLVGAADLARDAARRFPRHRSRRRSTLRAARRLRR